MNPRKTFVRDFYEELGTALADVGFAKGKTGIFTRPVTSDISGWVGLQRSWRAPNLEVFPIVGISSRSVETQVGLLAGLPKHRSLPMGISIHLGYLMPKPTYTVWSFPLGKRISGRIADLVTAIREFAIPFMEKNNGLAALCETMASGKVGIPHQIAYSLPVAYSLLGKLDEAHAYLEVELTKLGHANHDAAELYRRFAEAFRNCYRRINGG